LDLKEYSDNIIDDDNDGLPQTAINGADNSDNCSDHSNDELCEVQPQRADVKVARRVSKDQSN